MFDDEFNLTHVIGIGVAGLVAYEVFKHFTAQGSTPIAVTNLPSATSIAPTPVITTTSQVISQPPVTVTPVVTPAPAPVPFPTNPKVSGISDAQMTYLLQRGSLASWVAGAMSPLGPMSTAQQVPIPISVWNALRSYGGAHTWVGGIPQNENINYAALHSILKGEGKQRPDGSEIVPAAASILAPAIQNILAPVPAGGYVDFQPVRYLDKYTGNTLNDPNMYY